MRTGGGGKAGLRVRPLAMLLALSAHVGLGYLLVTSGQGRAAHVTSQASPKIFSVSLMPSAAGSQRPLETPAQASAIAAGMAADEPDSLMGGRKAREGVHSPSIAQPSGPYYFRMSELTEKPVLLHDALADLILRVPGLPPQPVILRLLINDEGEIDRVLVEDSFLAGDIERYVKDAFSRVRFEPGKIGRIAVRSQMRVEARLESMEYRVPEKLGSRDGIPAARARPS